MCFDPYILERMTGTRLAELRANAARRALLVSLRRGESGMWVAVKAALLRAGRLFGGRATVRPRPA